MISETTTTAGGEGVVEYQMRVKRSKGRWTRVEGNTPEAQRAHMEGVHANYPGIYDSRALCVADDLDALRAANLRLETALRRLVGTPENLNNGWRGWAKTSNEHFCCEYCDAESLDCTAIAHSDKCPVPQARAALTSNAAAAANGEME